MVFIVSFYYDLCEIMQAFINVFNTFTCIKKCASCIEF